MRGRFLYISRVFQEWPIPDLPPPFRHVQKEKQRYRGIDLKINFLRVFSRFLFLNLLSFFLSEHHGPAPDFNELSTGFRCNCGRIYVAVLQPLYLDCFAFLELEDYFLNHGVCASLFADPDRRPEILHRTIILLWHVASPPGTAPFYCRRRTL